MTQSTSTTLTTCALAAICVALGAACGEPMVEPPPPVVETWTLEVEDIDPALLSVAPVGDQVYAVGGPLVGDGPPSIQLRDGTGWRASAAPAGWQGAIWWLWATDAGEAWVVGEGLQVARGPIDALQPIEIPNIRSSSTAILYGVWGSSATDVWMVGGYKNGSGGILLRYDGNRVAQVELTGTASIAAQRTLFKVWGSGPDDVMIVGNGGVAIHYDGSRFVRTDARTSGRILTVHGRDPFEMYAVGGTLNGEVLRWDGFGWRPIGLDTMPPLNGVFADDAGFVWVVGTVGYVARYDGTTWTEVDTEVFGRDFHGVFASPAGAFAVGGRLVSQPGSRKGIIGRFGQ